MTEAHRSPVHIRPEQVAAEVAALSEKIARGTKLFNEARDKVAREVSMPAGYSIVWSGQFEYAERASKRLTIIVPLTIAVIFLLLYLAFRRIREPLIVLLALPFALVGGVWLIYLLGHAISVATAVGFIALAGVWGYSYWRSPSAHRPSREALEFYAQAFNLLNRANLGVFNGVQTSPLFGQATSAQSPRRMELGMRFNF